MNRRSAFRCFMGAVAGAMLGERARGADSALHFELGGAEMELSFDPLAFDLPEATIVEWVKQCATAVTGYYKRFPVRSARIRLVAKPGRRGVSSGRSFGEHGAMCRISLGQHASQSDLKSDWMLTHEMVHFGFPSVEEEHHWMEEGSATYIEPIARVRSGALPAEQAWGDMVRDMPQGLPAPGDQGLDQTHTWGRTYWGGAIFCLLADVGIRKQSGNKKGLEHAFRAITRAGGTIDADWPLARAFAMGDKATGGTVLMDLYEQHRAKPVTVDLDAMWKQLGVERDGRGVRFDNTAPLAHIRESISHPS